MSDISGAISDTVEQLGAAFLAAFYTPAAVLMLAHLYVLIPAWTGISLTSPQDSNTLALPLINDPDLASLVGALLLPFFIGMVLFAFNDTLIRTFEGKLPWLRKGLLAHRTKKYQKLSAERYQRLRGLRTKYQEESTALLQARSPEAQHKHAKNLIRLRADISDEHETIKLQYPPLPLEARRVAPTVFGNIYACAEEYPHQRYGVDGVLFWSRLQTFMDEEVSSHSERLAQQKTTLDMNVNFTLISGLLALESLITILWLGNSPVLLAVAILSAVLAFFFHQAAIGAVSKWGELIKISYDFHRGLILQALGLKLPQDPAKERLLWAELALFIRGGDTFYFPVQGEENSKDEAVSE